MPHNEPMSFLAIGFPNRFPESYVLRRALPDSTSEYLQEYETMPVAGFMVYDAELDSPDYGLTKLLLETPPGSNPGGE